MSQPRIFSLQKLVEVADFNMDSRGRIVWANVWGVLGEHFSKLGAHPNRYVSRALCVFSGPLVLDRCWLGVGGGRGTVRGDCVILCVCCYCCRVPQVLLLLYSAAQLEPLARPK